VANKVRAYCAAEGRGEQLDNIDPLFGCTVGPLLTFGGFVCAALPPATLLQVCKKVSMYGFQPMAPPPGSSMPSAMYYDKVLTDSDVTASPMSFLFWRVLNTENMVRLRC
jgi:hypothetical protein